MHLVRYGGGLAPHSHLREAIIPTSHQQEREDEEETDIRSPRWSWARLLKRVFALDMAHCPWCPQGALRIIAAMMQGEVIRKILRHLKLAVAPPHCSRACPPGSLCMVFGLSIPRASSTHLRLLPWGGPTPPPAPAPPAVSPHPVRG
jgi:hypothetical protein